MDELLEQFLIEGRELVAEAHGALIALGRAPSDRAALDSLFRATHTLKGSVALFDMAPAEQLLHVAEACLDSLRKGKAVLSEPTLESLIAIIDQTDRWIDAMERSGELADDAHHVAGQLTELFDKPDDADRQASRDAPSMPRSSADHADWLTILRQRPQFADLDQAVARTAFRYAPDAECFFRGDDPLGLVGTVPGLLALAVLPVATDWPALQNCEPFYCMSVLEGVSSADEDGVRAALRLAADQICVAPISPNGIQRGADIARSQANEAAVSLRVDAAKLDQLADRSGELGVAIRTLGPIVDQLRGVDPAISARLRAAQEEIERVAATLQRSVRQIRLVTLEPVLRRLPRLAREAAAYLDKPIRFTLSGENTQVDKQIADQLFEPLLHLLRNAIDHGLERPDIRVRAGKSAEGHVDLSIRQQGERILVTITDDGGGMDAGHIREVAVSKGLIKRDSAHALGDADALRLIMLPGFSTAAMATSLSGRGVGMDAVKTSIDRLLGVIEIDSEVGKGTVITLSLPASAITTPILIVEVADQHFGLRLDQVTETTRITSEAIQRLGQGLACVLHDRAVPVLDLGGLLGLEESKGEQVRLVVTQDGGRRTALRVKRFGERFDAVVREASGLLANLPAITGTAVMADGSVLLILDLPELMA